MNQPIRLGFLVNALVETGGFQRIKEKEEVSFE